MSHLEALISQRKAPQASISTSLPEDEIEKLDVLCRKLNVNRSAFVAAAIRDAMAKVSAANGGE